MTITHTCPQCPMLCHCDLDEGWCIHCDPPADMSLEIAAAQIDLAEALAWEDTWDRQ